MNIVAFGFEMLSGKDLAAAYLVEKYGYNYRAIATPVKDGSRELLGFSYDQVWGRGKDTIDELWGFTPRKALQDIMLLMREKFGDDFAMRTMQRQLRLDGRYVIADVRRINEARIIQSWGGKVVRIDRSVQRAADDHVTENELGDWAGWDAVITNNGTLENLSDQIDNVMKAFGLEPR